MTLEVGAFEAKTRLSQLLDRVRKGEKVVITKHGVPVAELVPPEASRRIDPSDLIKELKTVRKRTKSGKETLRAMIAEGRRF